MLYLELENYGGSTYVSYGMNFMSTFLAKMISSRMFQMALSWINGLFVDYHLKPSTMVQNL